jgi:isopentenyl diphosphate isomerase/L-lactate dehydrogenase-like FMN-dependent dehydrogenase
MIIRGKQYNSLVDLEEDACARLSSNPSALGYFRSGAESGATLRRNLEQFDDYRLLPRCLVDVSKATTRCTILGQKSSMPVMVAPMALQCMAHSSGELGMKRGSVAAKVPMLLSTMSTISMDRVARVCGGHDVSDVSDGVGTFFQLYCLKDKELTRRIIEQAERLGFRGIVITVDAPVLGKRESDEETHFELPSNLELAILADVEAPEESQTAERLETAEESGTAEATGRDGYGAETGGETNNRTAGLKSRFGTRFSALIDDALDWSVVGFCRGVTKLPIILKGVMSAEDAELALEHGVDAIVVSNHGGRQLDHCVGTLDVLQEVSTVVRGRCEVWVDGGVRRGTDVIKAIALGADAVLVGRPMLWALALGGSDGVEAALRELQGDVLRAMKLLGANHVDDIKKRRSQLLRRVGPVCRAV